MNTTIIIAAGMNGYDCITSIATMGLIAFVAWLLMRD